MLNNKQKSDFRLKWAKDEYDKIKVSKTYTESMESSYVELGDYMCFAAIAAQSSAALPATQDVAQEPTPASIDMTSKTKSKNNKKHNKKR